MVEILSTLLNTVSSQAARHAQLQQQVVTLNQSILAKAFRGELVPQDPSDEPASALLDRIRAARETTAESKRPGKRPRKPKPAQ